MVGLCLDWLGITDVPSYFRKLCIPILLCVPLCAGLGAVEGGSKGMLLGAVLGLAAPAALIWLCITLLHAAIFLGVFCAAWAVIIYAIRALLL
jgi:hypothetical protein